MSGLVEHVAAAAGSGILAALVAVVQVSRSARVEGVDAPHAGRTALVGAAVAVALGGVLGGQWLAPALAVLTGCAAALSAVDLRCKRLPDAMLGPTYLAVVPLVVLAAVVGGDVGRLPRAFSAAAVLGLVFVVLKLVRPAGIGLGDVKLVPLLGLVLGWYGWQQVLSGMFLAYLGAAAVITVGLIARRTGLRDDVPFGPYLFAGTLLVVGAVGG